MNKGNYRILVVHNYYKIPGGEDTVVQNAGADGLQNHRRSR